MYNWLRGARDKTVELVRDTETKARMNRVAAQLKTINFLFGTIHGETLLCHKDSLSQTLQNKTISAAKGQYSTRRWENSLYHPVTHRTATSFNLFWQVKTTVAQSVDIRELGVPHKVTQSVDIGELEVQYHTNFMMMAQQPLISGLGLD